MYIKGGISAELTGFVDEKPAPQFMDSKGSSVANLELESSWNAGSKGKESSISTNLSGQGLSTRGIFKKIDWTTPAIKSN